MANELICIYPTGNTLYVHLFDASGQIWNGSAFEAPVSGNWANYDIAMTESATNTQIYRATMPAASAGAYSFVVRLQAGGSPAVADIAVAVGTLRWSGSAELAVEVTPTTTAGSAINCKRGDTLTVDFTALGDISSRSKFWFTVKTDPNDLDTAAIIQIEESAGLLYINGAVAATAGNGSITVTDASAGDLTIVLDEGETDDLSVKPSLYYDVQMLTSAAVVTTITEGRFNITADVTRAIT